MATTSERGAARTPWRETYSLYLDSVKKERWFTGAIFIFAITGFNRSTALIDLRQ
jgi:hypothetical protein